LIKVIRNAKKLHYNNIILRSNNKMKSIWKIINSEKGTTHRDMSVPLHILDDKIITNQQKIANLFNNYFLTIADSINANKNKEENSSMINPINYLFKYHNKPFPRINWQYVSTYEINKIIKSLKSKNTSGYDKISNRIIKLSSPFIISPLPHICTAALNSVIFPDRLKYGTVKPIYKKGQKQDISNYRPISLLTSFSKVFERLIYNRLYTHFDTNNILVQEQFGFRMQHSTEQAAFSLINSILTAMNNNQIVGEIFCDLQKAFACVNHKILLHKLQFYRTDGKFKTLIESCLTNRYQKVTFSKIDYNNNSSESVRINCGVPQGAILGPLFFLIYINDLPTLINKDNSIVLYADDTSIVITDTNRDDFNLQANILLNEINTWFNNDLLKLKPQQNSLFRIQIHETL